MTKYNLYVPDDENGVPYCHIHNKRMSLRQVQTLGDGKVNVYACKEDSTYIEVRSIREGNYVGDETTNG